jgi:choice-of-anchor B domain-containing protein
VKKHLLILLILFACIATVQAQNSYKMRKLSQYNNPNLPKVDGTDIWNDLTGYYDPIKKREYIICGSTDSIYFFDITNPENMVLVDVEYGSSFFAKNRDFETYKNYVYCVSDQSSGIGGLQIFDLNYLPDSVHKVYESNVFGTKTHTLFIDTISARIYMCSNLKPSGFSAMDVLSISNPVSPTYLAKLKVPTRTDGFPLFNRVHEMFARNDTVYLSCEEAGLFIFDLRDTGQQRLIGSITSYPDQGYNHSSWLDKSGRYIMYTDENMGLDVKIFDIKQMSNPQFVSQFNSNAQATPHNAYWYGDFAYVSAYHDGVRVYNVKDPGNPIPVAWYDTHPETPEIYGGYKGCWGVYPFLPSKHIIASDLTSGIFVFEIDSTLTGGENASKEVFNIELFPNPGKDWVQLKSDATITQIEIFDETGKSMEVIICNQKDPKIKTQNLSQGVYYLKLICGEQIILRKFVKCE